MLNNNELKHYIITDSSKIYEEINQKITNIAKTYFKTMKNYSFQISQIESKLNEYNIKNEVNSSSFIPNNKKINYKKINNLKINIPQNNSISKNTSNSVSKSGRKEKLIIKEYIKKTEINNKKNKIARNIKDVFNKTKSSNFSKDKMISLNITSLRTLNDLKTNPNLINIKYFKKNNKFLNKKFIKKLQLKDDIENTHKNLYKSMSASEIPNKKKIINKQLYLKTASCTNHNPYYLNNNNYTIDEERNNYSFNYEHDRQTSGNNKKENDGSLANLLSQPKKIKKVRYRAVKTVPLKEEFYLINNYTFTNFNITNTSTHKSVDNSYNRSNSSLVFFNSNLNNLLRNNHSIKKINNNFYNIPYINNGIQIIPTRITKEILTGSYKIVNKYKNKKFKNYYK